METSKDIIRDIITMYNKVKSNIRQQGGDMSDFTLEDIVEMIYEEL